MQGFLMVVAIFWIWLVCLISCIDFRAHNRTGLNGPAVDTTSPPVDDTCTQTASPTCYPDVKPPIPPQSRASPDRVYDKIGLYCPKWARTARVWIVDGSCPGHGPSHITNNDLSYRLFVGLR